MTDAEKVLRLLKDAKELIGEPERWTKGASARALGRWVYFDSVRADSWCISGALLRSHRGDLGATADATKLLLCATGADSVPTWNDHPNVEHHHVMDAFDLAIAWNDRPDVEHHHVMDAFDLAIAMAEMEVVA